MRRHIASGLGRFTVPGTRGLRTVPKHIIRPPYAATGLVHPSPPYVVLQTEQDVAGLRRAGAIARTALELACKLATVGKTTDEVDAEVHDAIIAAGAYPAPLNYRGFPKSVCAAVNHQICHGIPDGRALRDGDVAKFDVSVYSNEGYFGDNCATVLVGDVDDAGVRLAQAARESVWKALEHCKPGACLSDIGGAIQDVADHYGLASVEQFCGHGVGRQFHMAPYVQHFRNRDQLALEEGMVFTIEPMLCEGSADCFVLDSDGWTVVTRDGRRAAQYEHTVAITADGYELLTAGNSMDGW